MLTFAWYLEVYKSNKELLFCLHDAIPCGLEEFSVGIIIKDVLSEATELGIAMVGPMSKALNH